MRWLVEIQTVFRGKVQIILHVCKISHTRVSCYYYYTQDYLLYPFSLYPPLSLSPRAVRY